MLRSILDLLLSKKSQRLLFYNIAHIWGKFPFGFDLHRTDKKLGHREYLDVVKRLKPGDILLRRYDNFLSNVFISGKVKKPMTHASIYVGESFNKKYHHGVVHAMDPYVRREELGSFLNCDGLEVWRSNLKKKQLDLVCKRAKNTYNKVKKYDYNFLSDISGLDDKEAYSELYCSELCTFAYKPFVGRDLNFAVGSRFGYPTYIPQDFVCNGKGFQKILKL